jgi:hypothetical protein
MFIEIDNLIVLFIDRDNSVLILIFLVTVIEICSLVLFKLTT